MLAVGKNGGIRSFGRTLVRRILVRGNLIFRGRKLVVFAFKQDFCKQEVGIRGIGLAREIVEILAIPASGFLVVAALAFALCLGVIVLRQVV